MVSPLTIRENEGAFEGLVGADGWPGYPVAIVAASACDCPGTEQALNAFILRKSCRQCVILCPLNTVSKRASESAIWIFGGKT
jgi:hypothetical protein